MYFANGKYDDSLHASECEFYILLDGNVGSRF